MELALLIIRKYHNNFRQPRVILVSGNMQKNAIIFQLKIAFRIKLNVSTRRPLIQYEYVREYWVGSGIRIKADSTNSIKYIDIPQRATCNANSLVNTVLAEVLKTLMQACHIPPLQILFVVFFFKEKRIFFCQSLVFETPVLSSKM